MPLAKGHDVDSPIVGHGLASAFAPSIPESDNARVPASAQC